MEVVLDNIYRTEDCNFELGMLCRMGEGGLFTQLKFSFSLRILSSGQFSVLHFSSSETEFLTHLTS